MVEWKIKFGDKEMKVTANDLVEMLGRVIPREYYYHENNDRLKADVQMKIIHELDIQMLELLKINFSGMIEEDRRRHWGMKIPGKKRAGHKVEGKPGDILDLTPEKLPGKEKL
jgi:hypothetical protein